ncbi:MAG: O-antigen ligase family protein [Acidimicrobiales bacterium]
MMSLASPRSGPMVMVGLAIAIAAVDPVKLGSSDWAQPALLAFTALAAVLATIALTGVPKLTGGAAWLAGWLAWAGVGALMAPEPGTSLLAVSCFAAIGLASYALASSGSAQETVLILGIAGLCSVAMAITASILGKQELFTGRLTLLFLEPNQLARAAGLIGVGFGAVGIAELLGRRDRTVLLVSGLASIGSAAALLLSESRTGVTAAAVGALVVLTTHLSRRTSLALIVTLALLFGAGAAAVLSDNAGESVNQSLARSANQPTNELRTLNGRTVLWPEVVDVSLERPVTGVGLGRDRTVISQFRAQGRVVWDAEHTHSLPLQLWLTTGVLGLIVVVAALAWTAAGSWTAPDSLKRTLALGLLTVVIVDGIVEPTLRVPAFAWVAVAAATGFLAAPKSWATRDERTTS